MTVAMRARLTYWWGRLGVLAFTACIGTAMFDLLLGAAFLLYWLLHG